MKTSLLLSMFLLAATANAFGQVGTTFYMTINMNDSACTYIVDGLILPSPVDIPTLQLAHFEQATSKEKLEKFGLVSSQCVIVRSSSDLDIENYIYRQVHEQVQQVGTQYKLPIAVNEKLNPSYTERRSQLSALKAGDIKKIKFLSKAEAQAKYGDRVVFGLIEITV